MRDQINGVAKDERSARDEQKQHARARDALLDLDWNLLTASQRLDDDEE